MGRIGKALFFGTVLFGATMGVKSMLNDHINGGIKARAEEDLQCPQSELSLTLTGRTTELVPKNVYTVEGCGRGAVYKKKGNWDLSKDGYELVKRTPPPQNPVATR
jgi:hypothetical protein